MLTNATITSLRIRAGMTAAGTERLGDPVTLSERCQLDAPTDRQRWDNGVTALEGDRVVFLPHAAGFTPALGDRMTIAPDFGPVVTAQVVAVNNRVAHYLGHWELLLRRAA